MDLPKVWKTDDGAVLTLRRLGESDTQNLIAFVRGLSVSARYFRFGQGDYGPSLDQALQVCAGHQLMSALLTSAKSQNLRKMYGRVLSSNLEMIEFVKGCGFDISDSPEGHWLKIANINL